MQDKTARAYFSVHNSKEKWPKLNFTDVVNDSLKNPGREVIEVLVMSAQTVDFTNLNTHIELTASNKNRLENEVRLSSKNMFSLAERALPDNPNLKKVIQMEHPPRFDLPNVDPYAVKPNLGVLSKNPSRFKDIVQILKKMKRNDREEIQGIFVQF